MLKPQATPTRDLINLDGTWRFAVDTHDLVAPWERVLPGRLEAAVPASYNDQFVDPAIRGHVGVVWYQRTVFVPRGWGGERIVLRIDAATHAGSVYVEDRLVAEHVGGYTPFEADLTDIVTPGEAVRLTIGVDNRLTNVTIPPGTVTTGPDGIQRQSYLHDFYNYAGLARSVWMYSTPRRFVRDIAITTELIGSSALVDFTIDAMGSGEVSVHLTDEAGAVVARADGASGSLSVSDVHLWQPGAAYLYDLTVELTDDEDLVDSFSIPVGVRTVEVRGNQFLINGQPFYFTGFGKHEDTAIRGKGHDPAYLVHDFQLLDWIGANSFRTSHYPYAEEVLEFADRHGIVVIDETAAVGLNLGVMGGLTGSPAIPTFGPDGCNDETQAAHAQHIRELIARDKNHPSVVMWCIANEPATNEEGAREYFAPLIDLARELDSTRPITIAEVMFATFENDRVADLLDVISLNRYYGWYVAVGDLQTAEQYLEHDLRGWSEKFGKPIMMAEYGVDTLPGAHSVWDVPWTEEYQRDYLSMHHRVFDRNPSFVGEQVWNFADFQTTVGIHRVEGNRKGIFSRDRKPKGAAHSLRERWKRIGNRKPTPPTDA
ncbi:beta-glucuronidase [Plantibacter flavus]|uniref:beta-glucuronidase n=1 Tax=Plantibacter flavus TaxID=150123 RepID=UPI003F18D6FA